METLNTEEEFIDGFKYNISYYLSTHNFVPHTNGNSQNYGLNEFGCNSIIKYNNDIWKFVYFLINTNIAVYINKNGEEFHYNNTDMDIIRMMEA